MNKIYLNICIYLVRSVNIPQYLNRALILHLHSGKCRNWLCWTKHNKVKAVKVKISALTTLNVDFVTRVGLLVQAEGSPACHVQDPSIGGNGGSGKSWLKSRDKRRVLRSVAVVLWQAHSLTQSSLIREKASSLFWVISHPCEMNLRSKLPFQNMRLAILLFFCRLRQIWIGSKHSAFNQWALNGEIPTFMHFV